MKNISKNIKNLFIFVLISVPFLSVASEYDRVRKAPVVNAPVWESFPLSEVSLTDSDFKRAMDLHKGYILSLEVDRLIPHVRRSVGLKPKGENYGGWETHGGCTYGHYMSACAMMYASTGDKSILDRIDYMLQELKECQKQVPDGWFISGRGSREGYNQLVGGEVFLNKPDETKQPWSYNKNGNSWYCIHKVLAGLRDIYIYTGRDEVREILIPLADFITDIALKSNSDLFQSTLSVEQGGMNEVFADIYGITGNRKYMDVAERFNHINVIYTVASGEDVLFGRHANDQIPKFIGVAREYEYSPKEVYLKAARNFWDIVIRDHTLAIGGNSCYERFGVPGEESKRLDYSSAETCNTHNMLKLSHQLFKLQGNFDYLNYYEHALYNHILGSQDPDMAGCVTYYTSLLPGSIKQYSTPYDSFWCCVGTGMENHSKYGEAIYFYNQSQLLVNLYIPSRLNWEEKNFHLTMDTKFPESDKITVKIDKQGDFNGAIMFRYPAWVKGEAEVELNGKKANIESRKGEYLRLLDNVKDGDVITLSFKRGLHIRYTKDEPNFGSVMYGPIVLAGGLGTANMPESDRVSDNRALRDLQPVRDIPSLVGNKSDLSSWIVESTGKPLHFSVKNGMGQKTVELIPYSKMHHQHHTVYWKIYSDDEYTYRKKTFTDEVIIGDINNEKKHNVKGVNDSVYWHDYFWAKNTQYRAADKGGWFSYDLKVNKEEKNPYFLICRFWGDESENNVFDIFIDGNYLQTVNLNRRLYLTYVDEVFKIPGKWTIGKNSVNVKFKAADSKKAGGLYSLKITSDPDFR